MLLCFCHNWSGYSRLCFESSLWNDYGFTSWHSEVPLGIAPLSILRCARRRTLPTRHGLKLHIYSRRRCSCKGIQHARDATALQASASRGYENAASSLLPLSAYHEVDHGVVLVDRELVENRLVCQPGTDILLCRTRFSCLVSSQAWCWCCSLSKSPS